jgi:hypothetical protein
MTHDDRRPDVLHIDQPSPKGAKGALRSRLRHAGLHNHRGRDPPRRQRSWECNSQKVNFRVSPEYFE